MRFSVFTHVPHIFQKSKYYAYAPYVKEMNLWLRNVDEVEIVAPIIKGEKSGNNLIPYRHSQLRFTNVPSFNLLSLNGMFKTLINLPFLFFKIYKAMSRADHIHIRCPGNIGLIACLIQILFPNKTKTAKYAGNWDATSKQPWSYKFQKSILKNTFLTRNMKVLVYGEWGDKSKNIIPFFTASYSEEKREKILKVFQKPYSFIFTGALVEGKRPLFAIKLMEVLIIKHIPVRLDMYGNGDLYEFLQKYISEKNLEPFVTLHGNQKEDVLIEAYKKSHFALLPSKSEGWPKAIAEAMFFGCIPVATSVSCLPWMLGGGTRGILISEREIRDGNPVESGLLDTFQKSRQFECFPETADAVSENVSRTGFSETLEVTESGNLIDDTVVKIIELINKPEEMKRMSTEAQEWSQQYTLERFEEAIKKVLKV